MRAHLLLGAIALMLVPGVAEAQDVGVASAVNQAATGAPPSAQPKTLFIGDKIIHDEKISTDAKGLLQILLADGSTFTVGPNSSMSIDSFVYDPSAGTAQVAATLGKGVFRFIGGLASKQPNGVTLDTPVGTVGIRGGISNLDFSGATPFHIDMVYGQGITLSDGTQIIGDLHHSGYSIVIDTAGTVSVHKTPPEWTAAFQEAMAGHNSGNVDTGSSGPGDSSSPSDNNPPQQQQTQVASSQQQGPIPSWGQIDNSMLSGVLAFYKGTYTGTATGEDEAGVIDLQEDGVTDAIQSGLPMRLQYDFGNRAGTAYFGKYSDGSDIVTSPLAEVPLTPDSTSPNALATFGFHGNSTGPLDGQSGTGYGDLDGLFLNTSEGVGTGMAGTMDLHVVNGLDGSYHVTGAFGGNISGIAGGPCTVPSCE